jgi:predicted ATPase/DNA-binding CsgD family transcriptional regulator/tetratricopeptide (TPR) repeat protein
LSRIGALLRESRLVTLTGPGGVGKTSVAIEAARARRDDFPDGVVFVSLAPVRDAVFVIPTIARSLGAPDAGSIIDATGLADLLAESSMFLVLDNLEQVVSCAVEVAALLARCPNIRILTTSRVVLNIHGERVFPIPPLTLPPAGAEADLAQLTDVAAIELFIERARAVDPSFMLDSGNAPAVVEICRRLDGLPLAIELAAARLRLLPPAALLSRLERRLVLLTGGPRDAPSRQQTLRDALAWSYDLLSEHEQWVFRRLSVFVGGFTIEAAEAITAGKAAAGADAEHLPPMLDILSTLVDNSLVRQVNSGDEPRFMILETIREFGAEQLESRGEIDGTRRSHANYVIELVEHLRPQIEGPDSRVVLDRFEREHPNIRAALTFALESGDGELGVRIVASVWKFWVVHSHTPEGRRWIEQVLALPGNVTPAYRLEALYAVCNFLIDDEELDEATRLAEEGLSLARAVDDVHLESRMLFTLGLIAHHEGDATLAASRSEGALVLARQVSDSIPFADHMTAMILVNLATFAQEVGDIDRALEAAQQARSIWQRRGDPWGLALSTEALANVAFARGDLEQAAHSFRQGQSLFRDLSDRSGMVNCLAGIAMVAAGVGRFTAAARLLAASAAARQSIGNPVPVLIRQPLERSIAQARSELGERRFEAAWQAGLELTLEDAFAEATILPLDQQSKPTTSHGLTARELDVLRLMAEGRTDREIADALFISYRTTTTHVGNILNKLGADSRTAAATDAVRLGLI